MNKDTFTGSAKKVEGVAESTFGTVTGNKSAEFKGEAKNILGAAQDALGKAEDYVCDSLKSTKTQINNKPVQSTLIALGIGFVLGKIFGL